MRTTAIALILGTWFLPSASGEEPGLVVGDPVEQFLVKDCTGPAMGKTLCYYCRYGNRPVVGLFVRELSDEVADLVVRLDRAVDDNRDHTWPPS